jgi:hypothetical protein
MAVNAKAPVAVSPDWVSATTMVLRSIGGLR